MGKVVFWLAGILMLAFEIYWFAQWWGGAGVVASVLIPPLAVAFPFIYFFKEGFSLLYFGIWTVGIAGAVYDSQREPSY